MTILANSVTIIAYASLITVDAITVAPHTPIMRNYSVTVKVHSRLVVTTVSVELENRDSSVLVTNDYIVQHPASAYLTSVRITDLATCCYSEGTFKAAEKARSGFAKSVSRGETAALISSYKVGSLRLKLSLAPSSTSHLIVVYSEVLEMKQGQLQVLVPISTLGPASQVQGNLLVHVDYEGDKYTFRRGGKLSCIHDMTATQIASVKQAGASYTAMVIPRTLNGQDAAGLLKCSFIPKPLPASGLLMVNTKGYFAFLYGMTLDAPVVARTISFVIDTSGSMASLRRLEDAKQSFKLMVGMLNNNDYFSIIKFATVATVPAWGPFKATASNRAAACKYIDTLKTGGGTNLYDATVNGIKHVQRMQTENGKHKSNVPVLILLTDGHANSGAARIVKGSVAVNNHNVAIYALAYGRDADYTLLNALTTLNGGATLRIYEGYGDAISQMQTFFRNAVGSVQMSDATFAITGAKLKRATSLKIGLLNKGSEWVVTGQLGLAPNVGRKLAFEHDSSAAVSVLKATISGMGAMGQVVESVQAIGAGPETHDTFHRMFATTKVDELMRLSAAQQLLGDNQKAQYLRQEALNITLEVGMLWPGLTEMLVVDDGVCDTIVSLDSTTYNCVRTTTTSSTTSTSSTKVVVTTTPFDCSWMVSCRDCCPTANGNMGSPCCERYGCDIVNCLGHHPVTHPNYRRSTTTSTTSSTLDTTTTPYTPAQRKYSTSTTTTTTTTTTTATAKARRDATGGRSVGGRVATASRSSGRQVGRATTGGRSVGGRSYYGSTTASRSLRRQAGRAAGTTASRQPGRQAGRATTGGRSVGGRSYYGSTTASRQPGRQAGHAAGSSRTSSTSTTSTTTMTGCTTSKACNYSPGAQSDDGSCLLPGAFRDCKGNCLANIDECGVCDGKGAGADPSACLHIRTRGDGFCDDGNNKCKCGWDLGDCCKSKSMHKNIYQFCKVCKCLDPKFVAPAPDKSSTSSISSTWIPQQTTRFSLRGVVCRQSCGNHGICLDGECHCDDGYSGKFCEVERETIVVVG